jgi:hypothetical protein
MNCAEWEERIALYAGGDLSDGSVERHLSDCPGCQVFASGLRETLEFLREQEDGIAPAHYAAVRARVMGEVRRPRRSWVWGWAAVAACSVIVAGLGIRREMRVEELPVVAVRAPAAPVVGSASAALPARRATKRERRSQGAGSHGSGAQMVVKMESSDPDVVIYWITETRGDN